MQDKFYIFGLQRSGTNFVENLIGKNFHAKKMNSKAKCWKHSLDIPKGYNSDNPTVLLHKNPYTWIESVALRNTADFAKTQKRYPVDAPTEEKFKLGPKNFNVQNLAKTYRDFYNTWLIEVDEKISKNMLIIKYETLLEPDAREKTLNNIGERFNLKRKNPGRWDIPAKGSVSQSKDYNDKREAYYKAGRPRQMTVIQTDEVNQIIGKKIFQTMEYQMI